MIPGFEETLAEMLEIVKKKNNDYAGKAVADPFKNFKMVEELGIASTESGLLTRITDKLCRVNNLLSQEAAVKDESIEDTVKDMANYSVILYCYLQQKKKCSSCGLPKR